MRNGCLRWFGRGPIGRWKRSSAVCLMRVGGARFGLAVLRPPRHQLQKSVRAAEQDRPDVAAARTAWADNQPKLDSNRPVFIDETGTSTKMARQRGRAPRGDTL